MSHSLQVLATGPLTTVQDLGRPGLAGLGVGRSGAADRSSLRLANRLVGNQDDAAGLEVTLGGLVILAQTNLVVAVTGAPCPLRTARRPVALNAPVHLTAGDRLILGAPPFGVRSYLAVRGGVAVAPVLGSRATDLLARLGPTPLQVGQLLPVGEPQGSVPGVDVAPALGRLGEDLELPILPGPRVDWFPPNTLDCLTRGSYTVSTESNRVGLRLTGPPLLRDELRELASEGTVRGALQVPPSGLPTLLLADHPVTGGYPVLAVVTDADTDRAAQARPGQQVRFRLVHSPAAVLRAPV